MREVKRNVKGGRGKKQEKKKEREEGKQRTIKGTKDRSH